MAKWYKPSNPDDMQARLWFGPAAITEIEKIITPNMRVIEHGSGGSTLWLAERCKSVTSYEHDPDWFEQVAKYAPDNANVIMWVSETPPQLDSGCCDLLIIDGEPVEYRAAWIDEALRLVSPGGYIVLDNANRPEYKANREKLQKDCASYKTINCNEVGTMYLVTEIYQKGKKQNAARRTKP